MAKKKDKIKLPDNIIAQSTDVLGREVTHHTENGKHYVSRNRHGATYPVECKNEKEAKELYNAELKSDA